MRQIKLIATSCLLSVALFSCDKQQEEITEPPQPTYNWTVNVRSGINSTNPDREDWVDNVTLAGSTLSTYNPNHVPALGGNAVAVFQVPAFLGKKDFFFAANLSATDQLRVGANGSETAFNQVELSTEEYLRKLIKDADYPIPMAATLRDVTSPQNNLGAITALSTANVSFERVFAKVNLSITKSANPDFYVTGIKVCNIPAIFRLGSPIQNYDKTGKAYLQDKALTFAEDNGIYTATFYLPEHVVTNPVFQSEDINSMTYLKLTLANGTERYFRIADNNLRSPNFGRIVRNAAYNVEIKDIATYRTQYQNVQTSFQKVLN